MPLSKDEVQLLKQYREIEGLLSHPGWKAYESLIQHHMAVRFQTFTSPIHSLLELEAMDGLTRLAALEHIKGVYNGLAQALTIPQTIVQEAKALRDKASPNEGE